MIVMKNATASSENARQRLIGGVARIICELLRRWVAGASSLLWRYEEQPESIARARIAALPVSGAGLNGPSTLRCRLLARSLGLEGALDDAQRVLHQRGGATGELVREKISDPHEHAAIGSVREYLSRCVVMGVWRVGDRPHEPARIIVEVNESLAQHVAVEERDDPVLTVQAGIGRETGHEPHMQPSPITQRVPDALRTRVDHDFPANRSHRYIMPGEAARTTRPSTACGSG